MNNDFHFRPHVGVDPELSSMQGAVYGYRVVFDRPAVPPVRPRSWGTVPQAFGCVVLLVGFLFALVAQASAFATNSFSVSDTINPGDTNNVTGGTVVYTITVTDSGTLSGGHRVFDVSLSGTINGVSTSSLRLIFQGPTGSGYLANGATQALADGLYDIVLAHSPDGTGMKTYTGAMYVGVPPTYHVLVRYPANDTDLKLTYSIMQNGAIVSAGTHIQFAGDPVFGPVSIEVPTNDPITLVVAVPGYTQDGPLWVPTSDPLFQSIIAVNTVASPATNLPTTGTPTVPVEPSPTDLANKLPPATLVVLRGALGGQSQQALAPAVPPPSPVAPPFDGTATGSTAAATGGDVAKSGNATTAALNAVASTQAAAANGIVNATNGVTTATNQVANVGVAAAALAHTDAAAIQAALEGDPVSAPSVTDPATITPKWSPGTVATVNSAVLGKLPDAPTFSSLSSVHSISYTIPIPKPGGTIDVTETVDFSAAPWAVPIAIFRGFCLVLLTLSFFFATFWVIRGAFVSK